ncbi:4-hydroxy-tetrahydrodipicolinate synthase [Hansschlegelia beijingensis]|uniref:4-hydroxy-tetrahydrodipicolinate synthase n=1 Tax=Hansschlegelia beijingensis TaxID=1133344 RepID=UPI00387F1AA2
MTLPIFHGSITALVTPMLEDGSLDEASFRSLVDWQIAEGTHGLVPMGTTGESPTVTHDEHNDVVRWCVEEAKGRVPVIAGAGSNSTREAVSLARRAEKDGADGLLIVTPYYNKPSQAGLYAHFRAVAEATGLPILIYNIPGRSVIDMSVETMARLYELPNIVGVKDATANVARVGLQRAAMGPDFIQLSGEDATALGFMAHGGHGCISVASNVAPGLCAAFQEACIAGDFRSALAYQDRLMPLHTDLFCETNPGPAKVALAMLGRCSEAMRLPMVPCSDGARTKVRAAMLHAGLISADETAQGVRAVAGR